MYRHVRAHTVSVFVMNVVKPLLSVTGRSQTVLWLSFSRFQHQNSFLLRWSPEVVSHSAALMYCSWTQRVGVFEPNVSLTFCHFRQKTLWKCLRMNETVCLFLCCLSGPGGDRCGLWLCGQDGLLDGHHGAGYQQSQSEWRRHQPGHHYRYSRHHHSSEWNIYSVQLSVQSRVRNVCRHPVSWSLNPESKELKCFHICSLHLPPLVSVSWVVCSSWSQTGSSVTRVYTDKVTLTVWLAVFVTESEVQSIASETHIKMSRSRFLPLTDVWTASILRSPESWRHRHRPRGSPPLLDRLHAWHRGGFQTWRQPASSPVWHRSDQPSSHRHQPGLRVSAGKIPGPKRLKESVCVFQSDFLQLFSRNCGNDDVRTSSRRLVWLVLSCWCRRLYWADWNRDGPKIEMSNMDGTERIVLVKDDLGLPNGLTFDPDNQQLCWADAGETHLTGTWTKTLISHVMLSWHRIIQTWSWCCGSQSCGPHWLIVGSAGTRKVECMDPHRRLRRKIVEGIQYPFALVSFGRNLYYTDWRRYTLRNTHSETHTQKHTLVCQSGLFAF